MISAARCVGSVRTDSVSTRSGSSKTSKPFKLDAISPCCCATCRHWLIARYHEQARAAGVPRNHAYCPKMDQDLEPFMNERIMRMRCEEWELDSEDGGARDLYDLLVQQMRYPI